ncbi:MAG: plastocyanin/azurin family copper-binding protein [Solirubrobacteraceae bacterium]
MPKRKSQGHATPRTGSRRSVRRTAEFITQQWLVQLSDDSAPARRAPAKRLKGAAQAKLPSVPKVSMLALMIALLALAGCGSSSSGTSSSASAPAAVTSTTASSSTTSPAPASNGAAQTLSLAANTEGQLEYDKSTLTAKAGKVTITMANMSPVPHDVAVASASGAVLGATPTFQGGSKTLTLNLKAGTYKFYCTVPGHRAAGMEGTLTVS